MPQDPRRTSRIARAAALAVLVSASAACWLTASFDTRVDAGVREASTPPTRDAASDALNDAPRDASLQDGVAHDALAHDAPAHDALAHDAPAHDAGHDASADAYGADSPPPIDAAVTCLSAATYRASVVASAPIAFWPLDEPSGSTAHDEMQHHNGSYSTGVAYGVHGVADSGVALNGNAKITVLGDGGFAEFVGTLAYTFEAWVEVTAVTSEYWGVLSNELVTDADKQGYAMYVQIEAGVGFDRYKVGSSTPVRAPTALKLGMWNHIVATYAPDGGSVSTLYVNGAEAGHMAGAVSLAPGCTFVIGATHCGGVGFLTGNVAEVAVYDYALDPPCIAKHFALGNPQ